MIAERDTTLCESCGSPCAYVGPHADSYCSACLATPWWIEPCPEPVSMDALMAKRRKQQLDAIHDLLAPMGYLIKRHSLMGEGIHLVAARGGTDYYISAYLQPHNLMVQVGVNVTYVRPTLGALLTELKRILA